MKILQINKYHYRRGGSETVYFNTAELFQKYGHEVSFFAMNYPENIKSAEEEFFTEAVDFPTMNFGSKIRNMGNYFYNRDAGDDLEKLIKFNKPDVAHIHLFYGSLTSSILVTLKKYKVPIVITEHDYRLVCPAYVFLDGENQICEKCQGHKFYNCVVNKCAKNSYLVSTMFALEVYYRNFFFSQKKYIDKIIFVSSFSKQMHLKHNPDLKDIAVHLYNSTPEHTGDITTSKGSYFLYIGRLSSEKGIFNLIEAFNQRPGFRLKIAGEGPLLGEILRRINANIEYVGFAKGPGLKNLITNCSFVIAPSEWYETLCMSAVEALSLGKPVIAAKIGGLPEVVSDNENGFLFEAFSLEDLLSKIDAAQHITGEHYELLSRNALDVATNKFGESVYYEKLMEIYKSVLKTDLK